MALTIAHSHSHDFGKEVETIEDARMKLWQHLWDSNSVFMSQFRSMMAVRGLKPGQQVTDFIKSGTADNLMCSHLGIDFKVTRDGVDDEPENIPF